MAHLVRKLIFDETPSLNATFGPGVLVYSIVIPLLALLYKMGCVLSF